jgi:N-acetylglucosamine-6-phosphate deacetylase
VNDPSDSVVLAAEHVVTGDRQLSPGWVEVRGDQVAAVGEGTPPRPPDDDFPGMTLAPGYVDTHVHGGGGASYSTESAEDALAVTRAHAAHGSTTHVASLVTAPLEQMARQVAVLRELVEDGLLAGIHLEGPWLSPSFRGAHTAAELRPPTAADVAMLLDAGRGTVRMVTLAPEQPGGLDAVRQVVDAGAVAAVGHTGADFDTTRAAIAAGATVATHLFNAMPQVHHREPGPVVAMLEDEGVAVELIVDNHHLHPSTARLAINGTAGGFHLVTDAMAATGAPDGPYRLGSRVVDVQDGVATLEGTTTLAGSTLTMDAAVRNAVAAGASPLQAIRAATASPARDLRLRDVGRLAPGFSADLLVLDHELTVTRTMRRGHWVGRRT